MKKNGQTKFLVGALALHVLFLSWGSFFSGQPKIFPLPVGLTHFTLTPEPAGAPAATLKAAPARTKTAKKHPAKVSPSATASHSEETSALANTSALGLGNGSRQGVGDGKGGSNDPIKVYGGEVSVLLNRNKVYPLKARRFGQQGLVMLQITLDKDGKLIKLDVIKRSPFESLNQAAVKMVESISLFPPIPHEINSQQISFSVPVEYKLN